MKPISEAIETLQKKMNENPKSMLFARLAEYLLEIGKVDDAAAICKRGLEHHPHYANAHYVLGRCYFHQGDYDEAEGEFNRAILYDPDHLNARHLQAQIMKQKDWQNAYLLRLKQVLAIDPLDAEALRLMREYESSVSGAGAEAEVEAGAAPIGFEELGGMEEEQEEFRKVEKVFSEAEAETEAAVEQEPEEDVLKEPAPGGEAQPEMAAAEEPGEETREYDYILDDIFKDEIAAEEEEFGELEEETTVEEEELSGGTEEDFVTKVKEKAEMLSEEEEAPPVAEEEPQAEAPPAGKAGPEEIARSVFGDEEMPAAAEKEAPAGEAPPAEEPPRPEAAAETPAGEKREEPSPPPRKEPIVTPTLGEIYAAQGHFAKAISVYEILLRKDPDNETYKQKIADLKKKLEEQEQGDTQ